MDDTGRKTHGKSKKIISRFLTCIVVVLLVIVVGAIALFWNELRTISSMTKIDDYGAYQMTYYGDYGFDEFLYNNCVLNDEEAVSLLAEVGVWDGDIDKLQWSVVYNLTTGEVHFFSHRNTDNVIISKLEMNHN